MEINCTKSGYKYSQIPAPAPEPETSLPGLSLPNNSPCAACKFLRRKCQLECVFAPYFPAENPQKFVYVHRVFGASNVAKLLGQIPAMQREDTANSLAYEAAMRVHDPVRGCVGVITTLQERLQHVRMELVRAKAELSRYLTPTTTTPPIMLGMDGGVGRGRAGFSSKEMCFADADPREQRHHMTMSGYEYDPRHHASWVADFGRSSNSQAA